MAGLDAAGVLAALGTVFQTIGGIESVITSSGVAPPASGVSVQIYAIPPWKPLDKRSGLASVSMLTTWAARLVTPIGSPPADDLDMTLLSVYSAAMNTLVGGFTLNGQVEQLDLLGAYGTGMPMEPQFLEMGGTVYRALTMTLSLVLDDVWVEVA
jgi:hypothetical protein